MPREKPKKRSTKKPADEAPKPDAPEMELAPEEEPKPEARPARGPKKTRHKVAEYTSNVRGGVRVVKYSDGTKETFPI